MQVNPEFGNVPDAEEQALYYAQAVGRLPVGLRTELRTLWIHEGTVQHGLGGGNNNILVHKGRAESLARRGTLEEALLHEAAHTSLDPFYRDDPDWLRAQDADGEFISTYARDYPDGEDIAESIVPWIAVRYRRERIRANVTDTIDQTIPNRMAFFDSLELDMRPLEPPIQARAYAIAPPTARDRSWVRVRCESSDDCLVTLDCAAPDGASAKSQSLVPASRTVEWTSTALWDATGGWGSGRLACLVRSLEGVSAQVWTRSGANQVLVNNTAVLDSELVGGIHVARAYSLPAPNSPSGNILNLRIRCEAHDACENVRLRCFDDEGSQVGWPALIDRATGGIAANGRINPWAVAHLQADHLAGVISEYAWPDLRMSCEVESTRPISVQILTRSGGPGGPLVNNTALSLGR